MNDTPNWWEPLQRAAEANGVPLTEALTVAEIRHDDDCARLLGVGICNCDPDVTVTSKRVEKGGSRS